MVQLNDRTFILETKLILLTFYVGTLMVLIFTVLFFSRIMQRSYEFVIETFQIDSVATL